MIDEKKRIIDVCCGSKMFWFDKDNPETIYNDSRKVSDVLCDGRKLEINPDTTNDFRNMPYPDNTFDLVIFDPPHLLNVGETSWMAKKYGRLPEDWQPYIKDGFYECLRILNPRGFLIMKWSERDIKTTDMLKAIGIQPLFGDKTGNKRWLIFGGRN